MTLFDVIQDRFFSILASKNKYIYVETLCIIDDLISNRLKISKDELCDKISNNLENEIINYIPTDDEDVSDDMEMNLTGRAKRIINILKKFGWIDMEYNSNTFNEDIILPKYSQKFIKIIKELINGESEKSYAYVLTTYSTLKVADNEDDSDKSTALNIAYNNTISLIDSFKHTYHNINTYYQNQLNIANVNDLLKEHFDSYRSSVVKKYIYPMYTQNSVVKFRRNIINIIEKWRYDNDVMQGLIEFEKSTRGVSDDEAINSIYHKINFIKNTYDGAEENYVKIIENRDSEYIRATTAKIEYLTNSDRSIKGKIVDILNNMGKFGESNFDESDDVIEIYSNSYIDETSLYRERKKSERYSGEPKKRKESVDLSNEVNQRLKSLYNSKYSKQKIYDYVNDMLKNNDEVYSELINNDEDFIKSALSVARANDKSAGYDIEITDNILSDGKYSVPGIIYKRRKKNVR